MNVNRALIFQNAFKTSGFAGAAPNDPRLVFTCDGVGSKLTLCEDRPEVIGADCVAMVVNDILAAGAIPQGFLNYVSVGSKSADFLDRVATGMAIALDGIPCLGGETCVSDALAFDVVGFAYGTKVYYEAEQKAGDVLIGIPSYGIHANGFTAIRRMGTEFIRKHREVLLQPTRIYCEEFYALIESGIPIGLFAHITGGGLRENISRVAKRPYSLNWGWGRPGIYAHFEASPDVFNCGIGFVFSIRERDLGNIPFTDYHVIGRIE